jgi:hypothetical protein
MMCCGLLSRSAAFALLKASLVILSKPEGSASCGYCRHDYNEEDKDCYLFHDVIQLLERG